MIKALHHLLITIPTGAEIEAKEFYCSLLELSEVTKPSTLVENGGFWLTIGDVQIHVGIQDGIERRSLKSHFCLLCDNLAHWRSRLHAKGIETIDNTPIPGMRRFMTRDPFGNRLEFIEKE